MRASVARGTGRTAVRRTATAWTLPLVHLLFVWAVTLFDLQFFLAEMIAKPLVYTVYLASPPLILTMFLRAPEILATAKKWVWNPPLLTLLVLAVITLPLAANKGLARLNMQYFLIYYVLTLGTVWYVKNARHALPIIHMLWGQFAWFALFAGTKGLVPWHPTLANYDGYGGLMVQGVGMCYWFAQAARPKKMKLFLMLLTGVCVIGVVSSFARAAFLSLIALGGWIWLRSPRKLATAAWLGVGAIVVVVGALLIFDPGFFVKEIMSAFEEGTEEGTGAQRWELWKVAFMVWARNPLIGVGGGNFGAWAAENFRYGELEAFPNPNWLYGYNLHNAYMQVLSELGIIGLGAFCWTLWDFQKRTRDLRTPEAARLWDERTGGKWKLQYLALGLEAANIANVMGGMFYASLFMPWFFTTWAANLMLWAVTRPSPNGQAPPAPAPPLRR